MSTLTLEMRQRVVNDFDQLQNKAWSDIKNGNMPMQLPADAVLVVSVDVLDKLPSETLLQLDGRIFPNKLLNEDTVLIMKKASIFEPYWRHSI